MCLFLSFSNVFIIIIIVIIIVVVVVIIIIIIIIIIIVIIIIFFNLNYTIIQHKSRAHSKGLGWNEVEVYLMDNAFLRMWDVLSSVILCSSCILMLPGILSIYFSNLPTKNTLKYC